MSEGLKIIAINRKARHDYSVDDTYECGIELLGTEVKSFRDGKISFPDAWAEVMQGEVWLRSLKIAENPFSSIFNHDPDRKKRLLLHREEIKRISRKVNEKGYTLIPLSFYFKHGRVKVELGLCKGKKAYDKRADIRERDVKRDLARDFRQGLHPPRGA
ncbi:MAG: SsrA-binding protein SmpB [Treponema sp.]|jgi:SsrA-binding protein|nr:SsrA-binding protein SmpB [Treponema sp.]